MAYFSNYTGAQIDQFTNKAHFIDLIYPVGSIYMSVNNTSPATLFGGTWTQLQNQFLLGAGSIGENNNSTWGEIENISLSYTAGDTGGSLTQTLTENNCPIHQHTIYGFDSDEVVRGYGAMFLSSQGGSDNNIVLYYTNNGTDTPKWYSGVFNKSFNNARTWSTNQDGETTSYGGTDAHNNVPPYIAVYMWERTA